MVSWTHKSKPPNGISIGLLVCAQLTHVPNTDTHTDHPTCDISRRGLIYAINAMRPKNLEIKTKHVKT